MRITSLQDFHADGGWEPFSFLKITTDDGLVGWSEFNEARGRRGIGAMIRGLGSQLLGQDPRNLSSIEAALYAQTRSTAGGVQAHAIGAIVNACLDIKAKALGVPVYQLLGGAIRTRLPVYWSHAGLNRARMPKLFEEVIGKPAVRSLDDIRALGREIAASGYKALKTNTILFDASGPRVHGAGFGRGPGHPELQADAAVIRGLCELIDAFRDGAGDDCGLMLDLNFNYKPEGLRRIARELASRRLAWLEMDLFDPEGLALLRAGMQMPLASLEAVLGRRALRPYLAARAVDIATMDMQWNGLPEALRMAAMVDAHEINVASHNSAGPLGTLMSAHLCAVIPNFQILEYSVDAVPWRDQLLTQPLKVEQGELMLPEGPGWGSDVDEDVLREHPAQA
jgi:L-alanine-DL-glutamate epimerase-like enolase superfamily enzyme